MHIHDMKIFNEMDNKFFGLKKKINIHFIDCLCFLQKWLCLLFIVFVLLYPAGSQHSFVHNFLMVVLPAAV